VGRRISWQLEVEKASGDWILGDKRICIIGQQKEEKNISEELAIDILLYICGMRF